MTDFVLEESINKPVAKNFSGFVDIANNKKQSYDNILAYANFLKQPLELWMFVPCGLEGNVLEEPKDDSYLGGRGETDVLKLLRFEHETDQYQQAKKRCLFEGFEIVKDKYKSCQREFIYLPNTETQIWRKITYHTGLIEYFFFDYYEQFRTIENLVKYNLELTPTALKQIGI